MAGRISHDHARRVFIRLFLEGVFCEVHIQYPA
jgi:hypothetical protein